jgi:hypothetical protein
MSMTVLFISLGIDIPSRITKSAFMIFWCSCSFADGGLESIHGFEGLVLERFIQQ